MRCSRDGRAPGRERLINVADESWKIVQHTGLGEWFQSNFKLARQFGVMNLVVLHKLADLQAAGDAGSRAARIAEGLIADASTRIVYHQDESQVPLTRRCWGSVGIRGAADLDALAGQALWRVGSRSFVVQHYRSRLEATLTNTDTGMRATRGTGGARMSVSGASGLRRCGRCSRRCGRAGTGSAGVGLGRDRRVHLRRRLAAARSAASSLGVLVRLPRSLADPGRAWPRAVRGRLPGRASGFYAALLAR